jgi:predicted transglutaminase-like cysteine proteinase
MRIGLLPFLSFFLLAATAFPAFAFQSYFAAQEIRADTIQMFPKWAGMVERYNGEAHTLASICGEAPYPYAPCHLKEWKDFLSGLSDKPLREQVDEVNAFINKYPYIEDIVNWGVEDYWETPYEFQRRNGDCEDFAIAKYMSLRALGVSDDILRVTIVRDLNLGGIIHAILTISMDGETVMLDNQIKQVMPVLRIYHYLPVYSINERHWWQYLALQQ